jgi:thymine-DNA glycosylase
MTKINTSRAEELGSAATFQGRLKLQDYAYNAEQAANTRRSPRLASSASVELKVTPQKRRAARLLPAAEDESKNAGAASSAPVRPTIKRSRTSSPKTRSPRPTSGYAPPSTYAHLPELVDVLAPNLLVLFVGLNPGIETARSGHAYAHPSNLFWKLLHSSGLTTRQMKPSEDRSLPELFSLGNTNIVARPSRNGAELSKAEMDAGVAILEDKARKWRPEIMCIVGKSIWESIWRVRHGKGLSKGEFKYGWQKDAENMGLGMLQEDERVEGVDYGGEWTGAKVFVATSTSGLAASLSPAEKQAIWRELGEYVERRRLQRVVATAAALATADA